MVERIPQHVHCRQCGKATQVGSEFCSIDCTTAHQAVIKKKKFQYMILFGFAMAMMLLSLFLFWRG